MNLRVLLLSTTFPFGTCTPDEVRVAAKKVERKCMDPSDPHTRAAMLLVVSGVSLVSLHFSQTITRIGEFAPFFASAETASNASLDIHIYD